MANLKKIAKSFKNKSFVAGQKPNPNINKLRKKYSPLFINKLLSLKKFTKRQLTPGELEIVEKLKHPKYGPFIYEKEGKYHVIDKVGEMVRIVFSDDPECKKLAELIREEYWKKGAHVALTHYTSASSRKHLKIMPDSSVAEMPPPTKTFAETYDYRIFLGEDEDLDWLKGLAHKQKLGAISSQYLTEIMNRRKMKWCVFGWPVPMKQHFVPHEEYRRIFLHAIEQTFNPRTAKIAKYYKEMLQDKDTVTITSKDGSELLFRIKGRPILLDDGILDAEDIARGDVGLNIPGGEAFLAPLETTAFGKIKFDYVVTHGFGFIKNLWLTFDKGKVIDYKAKGNGTKMFRKFLHANTGEKDRIAELGIGTNPGAEFTGLTIVDEKILGSVHIAIGNNTGAYHGKNKASSHLDMIKIMKGQKGNMYADNKLIMKNGLPIKKI
jgi:leucyl aminopeptidase (aminopeptidase T)